MNVAVLGLGSIGRRHAGNLAALGATVIGYDPDPAAGEVLADIGGIRAGSRDEALERAEVAVIATPNAHHRDDLYAALASGRHVFIEKPLAATTEGLEPVLERAREQGRVVFAGMNLRHHPCIREARRIVAEGRLGTPLWGRFLMAAYLPDWRPHQDYRTGEGAQTETGGVLFDMVHEFDMAWHLLGPFEVSAALARTTGTLDIRSDDCADAIVTHRSGVRSALHSDYVTRPRRRRFEIAGMDGLVTVDVDGRALRWESADGETLAQETFGGSGADDYIGEMRRLLDCVRGEAQPLCDGMEALSVLRQVLAARAMSGLPCL